MDVLHKIRQNRFLLIGRAGMNLYADPPGIQVQESSQFYTCLGGSSANMAVTLRYWLRCPMTPLGTLYSIN